MQEHGQQPMPTDEALASSKAPSKPSILLPTLLALLALLVGSSGLALSYYLWQQLKKVDTKITNANQQLVASLRNPIDSVAEELKNQQQLIARLLARNESDERKKGILLAEESAHLLTLAQYNLMYDNNYTLASKQLADADQKLQEIGDQGLAGIRSEIMKTLTALNSVPKVDQTALLARIAAISEQLGKLSSLPIFTAENQQQVAPAKQRPLTWKDKLLTTLQSLRGILTIRRLPEDIKPLPPPAQQLYIIENIKLQLAQTQWAVLHQNQVLYQNSLQQAKQILASYYQRNPVGKQLIMMIDELSTINIKPSVPDLTNIQTPLRYYINNLNTQLNSPVTNINAPAQPVHPSAPAKENPNATLSQPSVQQQQPSTTGNNAATISSTPLPRAMPS